MIAFEPTQTELPDSEGYSVAVIGIGGAGCNLLDRIALDGIDSAALVAMNPDVRALTNAMAPHKIQLGREVTRGLGAGGDPELGRDAAVSSEDEIRSAVADKDIVLVCTGLGGGTGSGAAPFVARAAREAGAFVIAFSIMPFVFEGRRRRRQADQALDELSGLAHALMTFENGRMGELVLPKEGIQAAFAAADEVVSQSVRAVLGMILRPGLIRVGLDDLLAALDSPDSRCLFGFGQAKGDNRALEALSRALRSPLLDRGAMLDRARNVVVHVTGGNSMTLYEVELLMSEVGREVTDDAQILFGVGNDPRLGEAVNVTIISSLSHVSERAAEEVHVTTPAAVAAPVVAEPDADADAGVHVTADANPIPAVGPNPEASDTAADRLPLVEELLEFARDENDEDLHAEPEETADSVARIDAAPEAGEFEELEEVDMLPASDSGSETAVASVEAVVPNDAEDDSKEAEDCDADETSREMEREPAHADRSDAERVEAADDFEDEYEFGELLESVLAEEAVEEPDPVGVSLAANSERWETEEDEEDVPEGTWHGPEDEAQAPGPPPHRHAISNNADDTDEPIRFHEDDETVDGETDDEVDDDFDGDLTESPFTPIVADRIPTRSDIPGPRFAVRDETESDPEWESSAESGSRDQEPTARGARGASPQRELEFEPASRGRFDRGTPTIVDGEDLDVPTILRQGARRGRPRK